MRSEIREEDRSLYVISVYNKNKWKTMEERMEKFIEDLDGNQIIIGGDFNIRTGKLGGEQEEEGGIERKSKDKLIGNGGRGLSDYVKSKGWYILYGSREGDWEGECTYVGARGNSVIDYGICNESVQERILESKVGDRVDSDHMPIVIGLDRRGNQEEEEEEEEVEKQEIWKICWDEEAIKKYKENTEVALWRENQSDTLEDKWEKLKGIINESMICRKVKIKKKELEYRDWWDRNCTKKKREVQRLYKR